MSKHSKYKKLAKYDWLHQIERRYSSKGLSLEEVERISNSVHRQNKDSESKRCVQGGPVTTYKLQ